MHNPNRKVSVQPAPQDFDLNIDVAIIGAGACGLTAATACANAGVDAIVFERGARPYGATAMSYGSMCAAGSELQKRAGIDDSPEALAEDILTITKGQTDPDLAAALAHNSRSAMNWLTEDLGLSFSIETNWTGYGHRVPRLHGTPARSGEEMMAMLMNITSEHGATLVTQADVTIIFTNKDGLPCGLQYESPDGILTVKAQAIIIASSGFAANKELIKTHIPDMEKATYYGAEWHSGDALAWAKDLQIEMADLGSYQALGNLAIPHNIVIPHTLMIDGGFQINTEGHRFHHELDNISGQALTILDQPQGYCWIIYDHRGHEKALSLFMEYRNGHSVKAYKDAQTLGELAAKISVPATTLKQTFDGINQLAQTEKVGAFGREFTQDKSLKAPYFAVKVTGALFHTQGGLCVDETARVRKTDGSIIPNLFAGGGAIRSVSGPAEWGYLPGIGLATAIGFGWRAGIEAAAIVKR